MEAKPLAAQGASQGLLVRRARRSDRLALRNMLELYLHDISEYWPYELDAHGLFGYHTLDYYWREENHAAFVFLVDERYAGFALVNDNAVTAHGERWMAQFFVLRKYRRRGVASAAARAVFDRFPARWEVGELPENLPAQAFWRGLIAQYSGGQYTDQYIKDDEWEGFVQCFDNRAYAGLSPVDDAPSTF
jgi:predicted acetyltransferase